MKTAWAVIPARGGSKGIQNKNLSRVAGRTLIERAINSAQESASFEHVIVTTDCTEIARESADFGALVVDRPSELSGDKSSSESAVVHALYAMSDGSQRLLPDITVLIQPTSPFIAPGDLRDLVRATDRFDVCFTMTPDSTFRWLRSEGGEMHPLAHDSTAIRQQRQEIHGQFRETGAAYAMRTKGFLENRNRFFGQVGGLVVRSLSSLEIDDHDDLLQARALAMLWDANTSESLTETAPEGLHQCCHHDI